MQRRSVNFGKVNKSMYFRLTVVLLLSTLISCATQRSTQPEISAPSREGISLNDPVLVSVLDARSGESKSNDAAPVLEKNLKEVYGNSIKLTDYFAEVPKGQVAVRVRLKANEANFGSRIVSTTSVENSYSTARAEASNTWLSLVVTASKSQTTLSSSITTEGWWVGTSWIELKVVDRRGGERNEFSIPVVAEKKRSNTLGYKTAKKVTEEAWAQVEQQFLQVMDEVLTTVRNQQE